MFLNEKYGGTARASQQGVKLYIFRYFFCMNIALAEVYSTFRKNEKIN